MEHLELIALIYSKMPSWAVTPLFFIGIVVLSTLAIFDHRPTTKNSIGICAIGLVMYFLFDYVEIPIRGFFGRILIISLLINEMILKPLYALKHVYIPLWRQGTFIDSQLPRPVKWWLRIMEKLLCKL